MHNLLDSLEKVLEARREYREASKGVEYDQGYFLRHEAERASQAAEDFDGALCAYIRERFALEDA